jgi:hypothetical protein
MQDDMWDTVKHLARYGLFSFHERPVEEIGQFFEERGHSVELEAQQVNSMLHDLVMLTAAEFALDTVLSRPREILPVQEPIQVDTRAGRLAMTKANCVSVNWCVKLTREDPALTLYDVTAFSSDVAKLVALDVSPTEPPEEIGDIARAVDAIERGHRESPSSYARAVGDSGVLRLQGFLWSVKLSLPRGEVGQAVDDAYEAFELMHPVGGVAA